MSPDNKTPYARYIVTVSAEGYIPAEYRNVPVFDGIQSVQQADIQPLLEGQSSEMQSYGGASQQGGRNRFAGWLPEGGDSQLMGIPIIPERITVHLGRPDAYADNVTVPFIDYIKNVASSEIYPTWPDASLRANIYAQVTFALNRVYTEWYRSRGYNFDITNSTQYDQAFVYGREIFSNISDIVDELFNDYVRRQGSIEPLFTQFCNGTTVTCDGLSQWGTVELAQQGMTPYEILQYYYGNDIEIVVNAPVGSITPSYPGYPLGLGAGGRVVRILQLRLNRVSRNYPAIPKVSVDGVYGEQTRDAVRTFQQIFNLNPDGIVGKATWYKLENLYVAVKNLSELQSEGYTFEDFSAQFPSALEYGFRGRAVAILQHRLNMVAAYYGTIPTVAVDGIFGEDTRRSVIAFQNRFGLNPDGRGRGSDLGEAFPGLSGDSGFNPRPCRTAGSLGRAGPFLWKPGRAGCGCCRST